MLVNAFLTSLVDYCCAILAITDRLQRVLNAHTVSDTHTQVRPRPVTSAVHRPALDGRSSTSTVQALCNCASMFAVQTSCVSDGLLHTDTHFLSAAFAVQQLPPAVRIATPAFNVWWSTFSVAGPMPWNSLPDSLHDPTPSLDSCWRDLKTLFS